MKTIGILMIMTSFLLAAGCVAPKPMYYWEDYSQSLYKLKKNQTDENLEAHKQTLVKIITKSEQNGVRVPPGVYCEYGHILMKQGNADEGLKYISLEEQTYPECRVFTERLQGKATTGKEQ